MKGLTLWQPWASAVACGAKRVETRSWGTRYRGPLLVHAARRFVFDEFCHFASSWAWTGALWPAGFGMQPGLPRETRDRPLEESLPLGAAVAVCDLVDVRPTDSFTVGELDAPREPEACEAASRHLYRWKERWLGDFAPGRFGWVLANVRVLPAPVPCNGARGLWGVSPDLLALVTKE